MAVRIHEATAGAFRVSSFRGAFFGAAVDDAAGFGLLGFELSFLGFLRSPSWAVPLLLLSLAF